MSTAVYKPVYKSMKCIEESSDWGFHDEVYAIFVGVDWTNGMTTPKMFVRRTKIYGNVDEGEEHGANTSSDNVTLTKSGKYNVIDPLKQIIVVQAMEHDNSSAWVIRRILYATMEKCVVPMLVLAQGDRSVMIDLTKTLMNKVIKFAKYVPGSLVTNKFINDYKQAIKIGNINSVARFLGEIEDVIKFAFDVLHAVLTLANPDDKVGDPKVLNITGNNDKELIFQNPGEYKFKFLIYKN